MRRYRGKFLMAWLVCALFGVAVLTTSGVCKADNVSPGTAAEHPTASVSPSAHDSARQELARVMEDPLFHRWKLRRQGNLDVSDTWAHQLLDTIARWRDRLFEWIKSMMPDSSDMSGKGKQVMDAVGIFFKFLAWVVGVVLLVYLIIVILRIVRGGGVGRGKGQLISRKRLREALDQGEALVADSSQWIQEAHVRLRRMICAWRIGRCIWRCSRGCTIASRLIFIAIGPTGPTSTNTKADKTRRKPSPF